MEHVTATGCTLVDSLRREEVFVNSLEVLAIPSKSLLIDGAKACCQNTDSGTWRNCTMLPAIKTRSLGAVIALFHNTNSDTSILQLELTA